MRGLSEAPGVYLGFISLHVLAGHLGSSLVYRLRFGRSPLAYPALLDRAAGRDTLFLAATRPAISCPMVSGYSVPGVRRKPRLPMS